MWILEFSDYKQFLKALIQTFPKKGRGQARKLADHLNVDPMVVSHILARERHLTPDQALEVATYFGLEERATEYFVHLVNHARADKKPLKKFYEKELSRIRGEAQNIKNLVAGREELSDQDKGIFYSNWFYCGIWLLTSIEGFQTVDAIADYFDLSRNRVGEILSFLVGSGLCSENRQQFRMAIKSTHVPDKSDFVNGHRRNWRDKAREKFSEPGPNDLFYSSPVSLSKKDAEKLHKELLNLIKTFSAEVKDSKEEVLMCLNLDWFKF